MPDSTEPHGTGLIAPILGVILSNALYLSSFPAVRTAYQTGTLGSFNVLPTALIVLSTNAWMAYAFTVPNPWIAASNLPGAVAAVGFTTVLLPIIPRERAYDRLQVQLVLVVGAMAMYSLWCYLIFANTSYAERKFIAGAYGSALCVILFASPLSTAYEVVSTGNAASIYAPLTATQVTNCLMWTIYGLSIGDVWVYGPNGTGLLLGLIQLALKLIYPSNQGKKNEETKHLTKESLSDVGSDNEQTV